MKKALCTGVLIALLSFNSVASNPTHNFNSVQLENLQYAYSFGEQFTKNGKFKTHKTIEDHGLGYIMAAIVWQESSAGMKTKSKPEHNAYGLFQNYLPTVRSRVKQSGWNMSDSEIKYMLKSRKNSARWAYIELSYWINIHNGNIKKAIASYNAGWNTKIGNNYANEVLVKANYLKSNNMLKIQVD